MRGMIEHIVVQDIFCSSIGAIERLDGNVLRLWFYVWQTSEQTGGREKVVVAKIIVPASGMPESIGHMIAATSDETIMAPLIADMTN
jgi:hypothetical protein